MAPATKKNIKNLRDTLPIMLEKARLEPLIPRTHIRTSANMPPYVWAKITKIGDSYIITVSESLDENMQLIALAHEIAHLKVRHSGFWVNFWQFVFCAFFGFILIENKFRDFGKELFIDSLIAPGVLKPIAPHLCPLQDAVRRSFIQKHAPRFFKKAICALSDLLVS